MLRFEVQLTAQASYGAVWVSFPFCVSFQRLSQLTQTTNNPAESISLSSR